MRVWGTDKSNRKDNVISLSNQSDSNPIPYNETANVFNSFFVNVARRIQQNITPLSNVEIDKLNSNLLTATSNQTSLTTPNQFIFRDTTNAEVKELIKSIQTYKSSGINGISSNLFKISAKILTPQFKYLFNLCMRSKKFPKAWKNTIVTPLFKNGDSKDAGNYRPIACIPLPGKLLEKCMHIQLYDYLESNHLLCEFQFGFRRGKNTSQAIFNYLDNIYQNINNSIDTIAVYVDFRKAFDTIDHSILINKLTQLNLSPNAIALLNNYLSDRTQQVFVNNTKCFNYTTDVPPVDLLSDFLSILYSIYITYMYSFL